MNYSKIYLHDTINGKGLRVSLFVSGCTIHCKGCFNVSAWDFNSGKEFTSENEDEILKTIFNKNINYSGLSILGGEPLDNIDGITNLCKRFHQCNIDGTKTIWIWSGYTLEQIFTDSKKAKFLLEYADYAVIGPFVEEQKNLNLKFRGSENQAVYKIDRKSHSLDLSKDYSELFKIDSKF